MSAIKCLHLSHSNARADISLKIHLHQRFKKACLHQTRNKCFLLPVPLQKCYFKAVGQGWHLEIAGLDLSELCHQLALVLCSQWVQDWVSASMARCFLRPLLNISVRKGINKERKGFSLKFTEWLSIFPHKRQHLTQSLHWKGIFLNEPSHKSDLFYVRCKKISC